MTSSHDVAAPDAVLMMALRDARFAPCHALRAYPPPKPNSAASDPLLKTDAGSATKVSEHCHQP